METLTPEDMLNYIRIVRELKILAGDNGPWSPVISTAIGAAIGGLIVAITSGVGAYWRRAKDRSAVQSSIHAEMTSLLIIMRRKNYVKKLKDEEDWLKDQNAEPSELIPEYEDGRFQAKTSITIKLPTDYNRVYLANIEKLGLLTPRIAKQIVTFYSLVKLFESDVDVGGLLDIDGTVGNYTDTLKLLGTILALGRDATNGGSVGFE
ncbi:hypothetical protein [Pseudomonas cerasi]